MAARIVLITGANSGVGLATTRVLVEASEEYHVIMAGRSLDKVENAMTDMQKSGIRGTLSVVQLDVTDEKSVENAVEQVRDRYGRLDVLINNAAVGNTSVNVQSRFKSTMNTNVVGAAVVAAAFRPLLLEGVQPYSIYVSSGMGSLTMASAPDSVTYIANEEAYRASKAALNMIAIREWKNFGEKGLKVFAFCPGFVVSNLRGTSEEARTGGGKAGDPRMSGETLRSIIEGERDADVGKFVHRGGVYPW